MNRKLILVVASMNLATILIVAVLVQFLIARAMPAQPAAGAPGLITYQGYLTDEDGYPLAGAHTLKIGIYAGSSGGSPLWEDTFSDVALSNGYFSVMLGSGVALNPSVFDSTGTWLQVTVDNSATPLPRQRIAAAPYALQAAAAPWSGLAGVPAGFADNLDGVEYQGVVVVAKSGGDYNTITAGLNSITDASDTNRYLLWVASGVYTEQVVMKPYIDIVGASVNATKVVSDDPQGTVVAASNSELKSISVENVGGPSVANSIGTYSSGATNFILFDVRSIGMGGNYNFGAYITGGSEVVVYTSRIFGLGTPTNSYGLRNDVNSVTTILYSHIRGELYTVQNLSGAVRAAASLFDGGTVNGSVTCTAVFNEAFAQVWNACP
jgi:hypothetical protein